MKVLSRAIAAALLAGGGAAQAASIAYFLDQSDFLPDGANYLQVTFDDEGAAGLINVRVEILPALEAANTGIGGNALGITAFAFNSTLYAETCPAAAAALPAGGIVDLPGSWVRASNCFNTLSFGRFENSAGSQGPRADPLMFSIDVTGDSVTDFLELSSLTGTQGNTAFWAEVRGLFPVGDASRTTIDVAGSTPVPIPSVVWVFGSVWLGLLGAARRAPQAHHRVGPP